MRKRESVSGTWTRSQLVAVIILVVSAASVAAADWPRIYGPARDNTSTQKNLLRSWPAEGPKVLWEAPLGPGFGGPAVSDGKVYLLDRDEQVGDTLRVFELASGKELGTYAYTAPGRFMFAGSRTTPTVDGGLVYITGQRAIFTPSAPRRRSRCGARTSGRAVTWLEPVSDAQYRGPRE